MRIRAHVSPHRSAMGSHAPIAELGLLHDMFERTMKKTFGDTWQNSRLRHSLALAAIAVLLPPIASCGQRHADEAPAANDSQTAQNANPTQMPAIAAHGDDNANAALANCAQGEPVAGGACRCGDQDLPPDEARFWQCVLPQAAQQSSSDKPSNDIRQYTCYRASGCYAKGNRYPQGSTYRADAAWCGSHKHPGGNYACLWDYHRKELRWDCVGSCECGDVKVQVVDGRVFGGDLPLGYENFECDDANGHAPAGYRAVTGHEYCADLPMMKGQTCRNQTIFCGAHSESMPYDSGYVCHHQKMICVTPPCSCGANAISFRAECRNQQVFCKDAPYPSLPNDGDYICTKRGWMCTNRTGCKSPTTPVSTYAIYKDGHSWCGDKPQYPHAADYICADDTWLCQNPKGCRFERQSSDAPCFATHDGNDCKEFRNIPNTTQYNIIYERNIDESDALSHIDDVEGSFRYICKTAKACKCAKNTCGQGFSCVGSACLCLDIDIEDSEHDQCMTHDNSGLILRDAPPCGNVAQCHGACIDGKCIDSKGLLAHFTPIENRHTLLDTVSICIDKSGCSLANGQYIAFGESLSPARDQDLWLFFAKRYGWEECYEDARETDIFDIAENLAAIAQTPAVYQCKVDPEADEHRVFVCKSDTCSCNGDICHNGDICSPQFGCMTGNAKRKRPTCGAKQLLYGQVCIDGTIYCTDPATATQKPMPKSFDATSKKPSYACKSLANGARGWFAQSPDAQCGGKRFGVDYECIDEAPICGGASLPGAGYTCQSPSHSAKNPKWTCTLPNGCTCASATCPASATCQSGACACGDVAIDTPTGWNCHDRQWTCTLNQGCQAGNVFCPQGASFDGTSCTCDGMKMPQNALCKGDRWICNDPNSCICNQVAIAQGDECTPSRFTIDDKTIDPKSFEKNTKRYTCGSKQCPPYTICYNGQCIFQSTTQPLQTPIEYRSVRGYPKCTQRSGCKCGDKTCKNGDYCVDNRCIKAPTYGLCRGKRVPIIQVHAIQRWRAMSHADDTTITWKSLFERIANRPDDVYSGTPPLRQSSPSSKNASIDAKFYRNYADYEAFDLACLTHPDIQHIDDYAYWIASSQGLIWDSPEELLPIELASFDEKSPFIYTSDAVLHQKSLDYLEFMDESSSLQSMSIDLEPIGWVCTKNTCKCGNTTCHKGDKCAIVDEKYTCSKATFSTQIDDNAFIQTTPYRQIATESTYDAIDIESENMAEMNYHRYDICIDEGGCTCGTSTCRQWAACVDNRSCLNDCPQQTQANDDFAQCIIPYRAQNCEGASGVDDDGSCLFDGKKWTPQTYKFHHALGAQCIAESCQCGNHTCPRHTWCTSNGDCITPD